VYIQTGFGQQKRVASYCLLSYPQTTRLALRKIPGTDPGKILPEQAVPVIFGIESSNTHSFAYTLLSISHAGSSSACISVYHGWKQNTRAKQGKSMDFKREKGEKCVRNKAESRQGEVRLKRLPLEGKLSPAGD
jgi:hypothetical protein